MQWILNVGNTNVSRPPKEKALAPLMCHKGPIVSTRKLKHMVHFDICKDLDTEDVKDVSG